MKKITQGVYTALITTFHEDGTIDFLSLERILNYQIANKVTGVVILGSTGESMLLNTEEKIAIINHVIKINNSRIAIIVGVSGSHDTNNWVSQLNNIVGIDAILVAPFAYIKPTQEGLYQYFATIAKITSLPIILYNVPSRTVCDISDTTILKLSNNFDNIIGLKDASGLIQRCNYLFVYKKSGFLLFSGDDATAVSFVLSGGDGVISVTSNLYPLLVSDMINEAIIGNKNSALSYNKQLVELYHYLFIESNPIPVKWMAYQLDLIATPTLKMPLTPLSERHYDNIIPILKQIGIF